MLVALLETLSVSDNNSLNKHEPRILFCDTGKIQTCTVAIIEKTINLNRSVYEVLRIPAECFS